MTQDTEKRSPNLASGYEPPLFSGSFTRKIDAKGKISVPSRFVDKLSDVVILTQHVRGFIWLFPEEKWAEFYRDTLPGLPGNLKDYLLGTSQEVKVIKNGRIQVPQTLREFAGLNNMDSNDVAVVGVGNTIQIWEKKRREAYEAEIERKDDIRRILDDLNV